MYICIYVYIHTHTHTPQYFLLYTIIKHKKTVTVYQFCERTALELPVFFITKLVICYFFNKQNYYYLNYKVFK